LFTKLSGVGIDCSVDYGKISGHKSEKAFSVIFQKYQITRAGTEIEGAGVLDWKINL